MVNSKALLDGRTNLAMAAATTRWKYFWRSICIFSPLYTSTVRLTHHRKQKLVALPAIGYKQCSPAVSSEDRRILQSTVNSGYTVLARSSYLYSFILKKYFYPVVLKMQEGQREGKKSEWKEEGCQRGNHGISTKV